MRISELAQYHGHHLRVRSARDLHFRDFKADESNAEDTEAAARFVIDLPMWSKTLRKDVLASHATTLHFGALLRLMTLAGSPNRAEVVSLHALDNG